MHLQVIFVNKELVRLPVESKMCGEDTAEHTFSMIHNLLIRTHHIFLGRICNMFMSVWNHAY